MTVVKCCWFFIDRRCRRNSRKHQPRSRCGSVDFVAEGTPATVKLRTLSFTASLSCFPSAPARKMPRMGGDSDLDYWWVFSIPCESMHKAIHPRRIQTHWKPIVAFSLGPTDTPWASDLITGGGRKKDCHEWRQPAREAEYLIEKFCLPSGMVLDPFAGSGTTLLAAQKLCRNFIGCEIDAGTAKMARRRLAA